MKALALFTFILVIGNGFAQRLLSGFVTNESNLPMAGAEIFVKNATDMRTVADAQGYYEMYLNVGITLCLQLMATKTKNLFWGCATPTPSETSNCFR